MKIKFAGFSAIRMKEAMSADLVKEAMRIIDTIELEAQYEKI